MASQNRDRGISIEKYRARQRGASHAPEEWFDVIEDDLSPVEVKSTQSRLSSGRKGRFRLWKDQHEKLLQQAGEYDFVVIEGDGTEYERTLTASEVDQLIEQHDLSFAGAGTHDMGRQLKLVWTYVRDF